MQMPAKGKKVALKDQLDDVTFSDAFSAFHHISDTMQKHQKTDGGRVSAFFLPVARLKAAAMTKGANGEENELAVRGVTSSNVIAMRDSIGHSGALMSANFLVCEQLEQVSETGASAEHTHCLTSYFPAQSTSRCEMTAEKPTSPKRVEIVT